MIIKFTDHIIARSLKENLVLTSEKIVSLLLFPFSGFRFAGPNAWVQKRTLGCPNEALLFVTIMIEALIQHRLY